MKIRSTRVFLISCWLTTLIVGGACSIYWVHRTYEAGHLHFLTLAAVLLVVAALTTLNIALRWIRWHYLTRRLGVNFHARDSLLIYGATLPAAVTPFYLGELVRPFLF